MDQWFILDGPGDNQWIENMNTVLDDTKTLCLANGQRIKIPLKFIFIFEMTNLNHITPSTISRCGIVYVDNDIIDWKSFSKRWYFLQKSVFESHLYTTNTLIHDFEMLNNYLISSIDKI